MLYFDKQEEHCRISVWHVTERLDELLAMLPDDESVRHEAETQFHAKGRIMEWVAVRVLLFTMLGRQVPIHYDEHGAPFLPDYEKLDISISHTKGYVAVALVDHGFVGIDIEEISPKAERVRNRFLRSDERAESLPQLILHWSAKETAFKILHRTHVDFLKHLAVKPFTLSDEGTFELQEFRTDNEQTLSIHYKVFQEFVLTYSLVTDNS